MPGAVAQCCLRVSLKKCPLNSGTSPLRAKTASRCHNTQQRAGRSPSWRRQTSCSPSTPGRASAPSRSRRVCSRSRVWCAA
eukprot:5964276-Prymnesium_polylepis.1